MSEYAEALRMVERLVVTLFGGLSIFLGFRLLQSGVLNVASGEWSGLGFRIKLTRASPGIFFCALGAIVLLRALDAKVAVERDHASASVPAAAHAPTAPSARPTGPQIVQKTRFLGVANSRDWDRVIAATNLAVQTLHGLDAPELADMLTLRSMVLRSAFGDADYEFYVSTDRAGTEKLGGEDRARWLALDRRAMRLPSAK